MTRRLRTNEMFSYGTLSQGTLVFSRNGHLKFSCKIFLNNLYSLTFSNVLFFSYPAYYSPLSFDGQNPEYLLQAIARLREALINDNDLEK